MPDVVRYDKLKFPLRPIIRLALGTKNLNDASGNIIHDNDVLYIPYNYLVSAEFASYGEDTTVFGSMKLVDPELGKITEFILEALSYENEELKLKVQWGWQDQDENTVLIPIEWTMMISRVNIEFTNDAMQYDIELVHFSTEPLMATIIDAKLMEGIGVTERRGRLTIIKKLVENYNKHQKEFYKKIWLSTSPGLLGREINGMVETYNGNNKRLIVEILDLLEDCKVGSNTEHLELKVFENEYGIAMHISLPGEEGQVYIVNPGGNNIDNTIKRGFGDLDTMYPGSIFYYNRHEKTNIINFSLTYEKWLGILASSFSVGSTSKDDGKEQKVNSTDNKSNEYSIRVLNGGIYKVKLSEQGQKEKWIRINVPIEAGFHDGTTSADLVQKKINSLQQAVRDVILTGKITILGDPNIYHPMWQVSNKFIYIAAFDRQGNLMPFYTGRYLVKQWRQIFEGFSWVTELTLVSLVEESGKVTARYTKNNPKEDKGKEDKEIPYSGNSH